MPDVGAGEARARGTVAGSIERPRIRTEFSPLDVQPAFMGEDGAVPSHARRCDAVEQIDAATDALDQVLRKADAHQVAWVGAWKGRVDHLEHLVHRGFFFTDREPADGVTGPVVHRRDLRGCFTSKCWMYSALNDRE